MIPPPCLPVVTPAASLYLHISPDSLSGGSTRSVDREIDATGYVRSEMVDRASAYTNDDANTLSHDRAGLLSMRRGGGSFEFGLTPAPNPVLDLARVRVRARARFRVS